MSFQCFVCDQTFKKAQYRASHIRQKKDSDHQQYARQYEQKVIQQFSDAIDTVSGAVASASGMRSPVLEAPFIESNDVDENDLPSSRDMDIDSDSQDFDEPDIISEPGEPIEENQEKDNEHIFQRALETIETLNLEEIFDFLPEPDLEEPSEGEADPGPSTAASLHKQHVLIDDDTGSRTYQWHDTAGRIYGTDNIALARWETLFSKGSSNQGYTPFSSRLDWEIAQWAVKEKIPQKSFDRLLKIPQVKEKLGLSFSNARSMLQSVDAIPNRCSQWYTKRLSFKDRPDEHFTIHHRNPIEAIKGLWGDPAFANFLVYKPAKLFRNAKQTEEERMFSEMWTGGFWNAAQTIIPKGGTIAPVIIATDKTKLTQFSGNKVAYPVYLTLGNIPKSIRRKPSSRACVLIAYLSVDKPSKKGLSETALRVRNYELFHRSMAIVLEPLKAAGDPGGQGVDMVGGDGAVRRVYPLLATYVADYPEQCLVTCTKYGTCPKCRRKADELHLPSPDERRTGQWTLGVIQMARATCTSRSMATGIHAMCMESNVAGGNYEPFWTGFPLVDIHRCISPDVLHQLYQGVLKHLILWVQDVMGEEELDRRVRLLPPACGVRHFKNGISGLSQVSGVERKHIARILLSCLVGKIDSKGLVACRSLLHFIQLAQYPSHDEETLGYMEEELNTWHKYRSYFIDKGIRDDFNIPKFHSLIHYIESIRWLGTTDNYNTEMFERLHIDFAKEGWRASNKRDHFPQMIKWLSRQEKIASFDFFRSWVDEIAREDIIEDEEQEIEEAEEEQMVFKVNLRQSSRSRASDNALSPTTEQNLSLTRNPSEPKKSLARILLSHSAPGFLPQLKLFLNSCLPSSSQLPKLRALQGIIPFMSLDVWHQYKFFHVNVSDDDSDGIRETIKAIPISKKHHISRFDTVIILDTDEAESTAVEGCRVGRVQIIFRLPETVSRDGFVEPAPSQWPKDHLAYVTWFSRFRPLPDKDTGMYRVERAKDSKGQTQGSIIPLTNIQQSCMLTPSRFAWEETWTKENILDKCDSFFVNNLQSKYSYQTIY